MTTIKQDIYDGSVDTDDLNDQVEAKISIMTHGVELGVKGYSNLIDDEGCVAYLEYYESELRLIVWANINEEDPTHIINLEGARNERRDPDE
jgi:hypothetical protein